MRSLIWGAGAIGGTLGAYLARAGGDITMVDTVVEHVDLGPGGRVVSAQNGLNELPLTNASIADALAMPAYRHLYIALAREVLAVAAARAVQPESFDGFDPSAYLTTAPAGAAARSLDALVAHNRRSAKSHSGIWRDLAVRKRPTEVDAQLGIVVRLGAEAGVAAPLTARLVALIHEIERGARPQSLDTLDALAATPHTVTS
jgi:ketopantoate reductase